MNLKIRIMLVIALMFIAGVFIGAGGLHWHYHSQKHTGPATLALRFTSRCYWFQRPNAEIFEMCFDNPPPWTQGLGFSDITYTDDNADLRHLMKAQLRTK